MPPRRTYNEHRARFPLGLGSTYVDLHSSSNFTEKVLACAFIKRHMHVPTCTWRTWVIKSELLLRHTWCHRKKIDPIRSLVTIVI